MLTAQKQKFSSQSSPIKLKTTRSKDWRINSAIMKFNNLNNMYQIQYHQGHSLNLVQNNHVFPLTNRGKYNSQTAIARLKYLQNYAMITQANRQQQLRQKKHKKIFISTSHNPLKKKIKLSSSLNPSYRVIYNNFIQQQLDKSQSQSHQSQDHSFHFGYHQYQSTQNQQHISQENNQSQNISAQDIQFNNIILYQKQLSPYKKILQFTKNKIQQNKNLSTINTLQSHKKFSQHLTQTINHQEIYQSFTQLSSKISASQSLRQHSKHPSTAQQLLQTHLHKIYRNKYSILHFQSEKKSNRKETQTKLSKNENAVKFKTDPLKTKISLTNPIINQVSFPQETKTQHN